MARVALMVGVLLMLGALSPGSARVRQWMAVAKQAAKLSDVERQHAAYVEALTLTSDHPAVYTRLVEMHLAAGNANAARVYLYALADRAGWNARRRDWLRDILAETGNTAGETALLYEAAERHSNDPQALRQLATQQIARLDWMAVERTLTRWMRASPGDAAAWYWMGLLHAPENPAQAVAYLMRAADDPTWAARANAVRGALTAYDGYTLSDAHTQLGVTLTGLGEWAFAERAFNLALDVNAVNPVALAYRGFARDQQGRDGLPDLQAGREMSPNDPVVHYLLGQHWRLVENYAAAYDAFLQAYTLDEGNPALAVDVALSLQGLSEFDRAERWFRRAVERDPDAAMWQRTLARFYADTGYNLEIAGLPFIQQARAAHPDDATIAASLGWAYYRANDLQRAYDELNYAMSIDPASPRTRYYFGMVLARRGDAVGAADSFYSVVDDVGTDRGFGLLAARALQQLGYAPS